MIDHEKRKKTIGASEIAAVLGLSEYKTPLQVWLEKTGQEAPFSGNEHTRRGQRQESQILDWLEDQLEDEGVVIVRDLPPIQLEGTIASATPDGVIVPCQTVIPADKSTLFEISTSFDPKNLCLVEAKSTLRRVTCVDEIDIAHLLQTQWQMGVTGVKAGKLVLFGPMVSDYQYFDILFDEALFAKMLTQATEWWERHVIGGIMPDPITAEDAFRLWPRDNGGSIDVSESVYLQAVELRRIKDEIKALGEREEKLVDAIKVAAQDFKEIRYAGVKIASVSTVTPSPPKMPKQREPYRMLRLCLDSR